MLIPSCHHRLGLCTIAVAHCVIILAIAVRPATAQSSLGFEPALDAQTPTDQTSFMPLDDPLSHAAADDWRFQFNSWIWLMGVEGDVGVRGTKVAVDADFGDILDASDSLLAFSGRLEVGYKRFGAFVDGIYADIGADDRSGPAGLANIDVTMELGVVDFGLMYRLFDLPTDTGLNTTVDVYSGARYIALDVELDPAMLASISRDRDWFDPIVGAKLRLPLTQRLHLELWGDIGGFGVESDFTWSATGVLGFNFELFKLPMTIYGGYRAMGWDYSTGSGTTKNIWDVILHGPVLGGEIRF